MRIVAEKPKTLQQVAPAKSTLPDRAHVGQSHEVHSILHLQRTIGNQAMQRLLQAYAEEFVAAGSATTASTRVEHDVSRMHVHPPAAGSIQTKLAINKPGDEYEQEADHAVPPLVHEVVRSAGQPLDPATRAFMEPRFGHDFSQVRVHTDAKAAESARDLNANAYTVGRNIVFGAGQFLPGTQVGRQLLSHELTHVVQQGRSPVPVARSLGVAGDVHERQAGAVADASMRGGDIAGFLDSGSGPTCPSLQRDTPPGTSPSPRPPTTAPPPPPRPLDYDRDPKNVAPVPPGQTAASVKTFLNDKIRRGEITRFAVAGVQTGSHAEIFLLALLYGMAQRTRWGTEADIVTAIDWPAKPGNPPPQGRVTVRLDPQGAASAELIAAGPVPAVAQTTVAAGSAKLMADFGFATVTGWSGQNPMKDAAEISDVLAALELMKSRAPQDIPALAGVDLMRVPSLSGQRAGEFFAGSQVALGATADIKPWLKLANRAFDSNTVQFFGGGPGSPTVPASFQVILHEVGHAVETEQLRLAREGYVRASADVEAARKLLAGDPATFDAELKEAKRKGKRSVDEFYKKQAATYKRNTEAQEQASTRQQEAASTLENTKVAGSGRTRRLQKFIDLVTANNIRRFTRYSVENWPQNPEEFYAEAYSLWLVDPAFMRTNYRVVYDFFQSGDYRR